MRNAFKKSTSKSKNFVKRVLSKTNSLNASDPAFDKATQMEEDKPPVNIEMELFSLKKQIDSLQKSVNFMQYDNETKEEAMAKLARDKEQLHVDLNKQRRSNTNLRQQLEDERKFYYKEKEQYCIEMTEAKKLKQKLNEASTNNDINLKEIFKQKEESMQTEIQDLQERINITLEANYNLSIKFLRMKNTKFCLKNRLKRLQIDHNTDMEEFRKKLEKVENELVEIVHKEFLSPITPSSKKYLQLIKYNGQLIHENLALKQQTERFQLQLEKIKMQQVREETNQKLQYYKKRSRSESASGLSHKGQQDKKVDNVSINPKANTRSVEKLDAKEEKLLIGQKKNEIRGITNPASPITPVPLRTSPSLDIQTLYERKKSFQKTPKPSSRPSLKHSATSQSKPSPSPKARIRPPPTSAIEKCRHSNTSSITIQPLDNSKAVTLPADVVPSCTNLRLLCQSENEGTSSCGSNCGDSREGCSSGGRDISSNASTEAGRAMASSMNLLQVSNCTSTQNTEMSFYTTVYNDNRPQSAPAAGSRGTNTGND